MYDKTPKCANEILRLAHHRKMMGENLTYIICGRCGPTGKTWLWNALREAGHNAIEISEGINRFVNYPDDKNHMCDSGFGQVIIVLNKPLDDTWVRWQGGNQ